MHDILVPADPADLIDRIIALQLRMDATPDNAARSDLARRQALLTRLAGRVMPADQQMADLTQQLHSARYDLVSLTLDLRDCDARKDYGIAFVALSQALLAAMATIDATKAAINICADLAAPPALRDHVI